MSLSKKLDPELVSLHQSEAGRAGEPTNRATAESVFSGNDRPAFAESLSEDAQLGWPLCPADARIQAFLDETLKDVGPKGRSAFT